MHVSVENTSHLGRKLRVELPEDQIHQEVQNRLRSLSRTTRIQGFRPGKAPIKVIQKHYGARVRQEVIGELIQSSFYEAVNQENLKPASMPDIAPEDVEQESGLVYTATFDVYPEVKLASIDNLKIEKEVCNISDQDLDNMINQLRKQQRTLEKVDRTAQEGDVLVIDFEGRIKNEKIEGGEATDFRIELGSNQLIEGFEQGLIGTQTGEEKKLDLKFPDNYHKEEYSGKPVEFTVKIKEVNMPVLPELDDAFFTLMGVKEGGLDAFKDAVRENMAREAEHVSLDRTKHKVLDALYEANKMEVPDSLVKNEATHLEQQLINNLKQQGMKESDIPKGNPEPFRQQAEKRVNLQLIVSEIVKSNEIKAEPARIRQMIEKFAASYEQPEDVVKWYYSDKQKLAEVEALVLEDEVVNWILGKAQVEEKEMSFDELMNKGQTD